MFILWWFCSLNLKPKMKSIHYLLVFISGAICSYMLFALMQHMFGAGANNSMRQSKMFYLPEERFLEVRNDFSVQSPSDGTSFMHKDVIEEMAKNKGVCVAGYSSLNCHNIEFCFCSKFAGSTRHTSGCR